MKITNTGIGYIPEETTHCFILDIKKDFVTLSESYDGINKILKVSINKEQWSMIKFNIIQYFKQYITKNNLKSNRLTSGDNFLSRLLGKEIGLLFLGIEDTVDEDEIIKALKNWNGLDVTEKWYLYTMANANLSKDHNKGWRGAIKKILIEN